MRELVVKEEYVKITKSFYGGIILNYILETNKNKKDLFKINFSEILDETFLDISEITLRREIKKLVSKGFLLETKILKSLWYEINTDKINEELVKIGAIEEELKEELDEISLEKISSILVDKRVYINKIKTNIRYYEIKSKLSFKDRMLLKKIYLNIIKILDNKENYISIDRELIQKNEVAKIILEFDICTIEQFIFKLKMKIKNTKRTDILINRCIKKEIKKKQREKSAKLEKIYVVFSAGGGTGSGAGPLISELLIRYSKKKVGIITILPSENDTLQAHINAYECFQEISNIESLGGVFVLDNNANKNNVLEINTRFVSLFDKIFKYKEFEIKYGNIDDAEILKLLNTYGVTVLASCKNNESTKDLIKKIKNGIFCPLENDAQIKYLGLFKSIRFDEELFKSDIGRYIDKFEAKSDSQTFAIITGLTFPFNRILSLREKIENEKELILSEKESVKLESLDFLTIIKQEFSHL